MPMVGWKKRGWRVGSAWCSTQVMESGRAKGCSRGQLFTNVKGRVQKPRRSLHRNQRELPNTTEISACEALHGGCLHSSAQWKAHHPPFRTQRFTQAMRSLQHDPLFSGQRHDPRAWRVPCQWLEGAACCSPPFMDPRKGESP